MSLQSQSSKKEREYLAYLKTKLESNNASITTGNLNKDLKKEKEKDKDKDVNLDITKSEFNFTTLFPITVLVGQKNYNNNNNLISVGMKDGSVLVWDAELHIDKFLFQENRGEITSVSIDDNYLTSGTIDGQFHVYDLITGNLIYTCHHNPYKNYPIALVK
jgi:WD40 repeat protein